MKSRTFSIAAIVVLGIATALVPALPASAAGTSPLTVRLVAPNGTALGSSLDATASINVEADGPDGTVDFNAYYAADDDSTDYPDSERLGALVGGTATFDVPQGDEVYISTRGGAEYLPIYQPLSIGASALTANVKTVHGGVVSGLIQTSSGPLRGSAVTLGDKDGFKVAQAITDASGDYRVVGIRTGSYRVQFNSRTDSGSAAESSYTWNYWRGATRWSTAHVVSVTQQTATSAFSTTSGIDDTVAAGHTMTVVTDFPTPSEYEGAQLDFIPVHQLDWSTSHLNDTGTSGMSKLAPGVYKIEISTPDHNWYWTGNGTKASSKFSQAKTITFSGTQNLRVLFN